VRTKHSPPSPRFEWGQALTRFGNAFVIWRQTPESEGPICALGFGEPEQKDLKANHRRNDTRASQKLRAVIEGLDTSTLLLTGTGFQKKVWAALMKIPRGQTRSYGEIADQICCNSARAVGQAIGANPVALLVPCHRVIQKNGSLGGYRWGIETKRALLDWEAQ